MEILYSQILSQELETVFWKFKSVSRLIVTFDFVLKIEESGSYPY